MHTSVWSRHAKEIYVYISLVCHAKEIRAYISLVFVHAFTRKISGDKRV